MISPSEKTLILLPSQSEGFSDKQYKHQREDINAPDYIVPTWLDPV